MEYKMGLQEKYFNDIRLGTKKIEIRLNDEKRKLLNIGDTLYFLLEPDRKKSIETKIVNLTQYNNFEEAVNSIPINYLASINDSKENYLNDLNKYYSKKDQEKFGVLAIEVELQEKSCGVVVFDENKILLNHHNKGHWGIPKGHVEENETEHETAIREVFEETGIDTEIISDFRKVITYKPKENSIKDVVFFIGKAKTTDIKPQLEEVSEVKFVEINEALELIGYDDERELLECAFNYYVNGDSYE